MRVDFVANVSHEIRTPLTSIKGFSQLLQAQSEKLPETAQLPLERIVFNIGRLEGLFDTLLELSVIESHHSIDKSQINLSKILNSIKLNLLHKYKKEFQINFEKNLNIYGDGKLLEHAFTNLIDNSIKYSSKKFPVVNVSLVNNSDHDIITISDNGSGIPQKDLERIFERFYRVQGQEHQKIEGTGLGLSIVKHVITKHNGIIHVESKLQEGSKFKISLPKKQGND
jgi:signal transduction histidine kinase